MKLKLLFLATFIFCTILGYSQNAREILDKASDTYNKAGGITAAFTLETKDSKNKSSYSSDGKAYMKGDKFKIQTPQATTWFDGKTQWVYINDSEEVNISTPTGDELQSLSPVFVINMYKKGFNLSYKGEKNLNGKTYVEIEMATQKKNADVSRINVLINKTNYTFNKITVYDKSGLQNTLSIRNYQSGVNLLDNTFIFNKKEYPKAEIIDLR